MPAIPDFNALAQQQGQINQSFATQQTQANRANQYNPYGSLTWGLAPDGTWTQTTRFNEPYQNLDNSITAGQTNLGGMIGQGVNTGGLSDFGSTDITRGVSQMPDGSFGASQQVIDAMKQLQQPGLSQARDAERARLAAMGITLGSDASNNSERVLGGTQNDADLKAILAGTQEYGNVFNRQLAQRQQGVDENIKGSTLANAVRGQQMQERLGAYGANVAGMGALTGAKPKLDFASYAGATALPPANMYGAATDSFNAQLAAENAARAQSQARQQGNVGLAQAGLGMLGGVSGIGGLLGSGMSALGNMWGNITGSPGSDSWFANLGDNGDQTDYLAGQGDALGDFGSEQGWW